MGALTANEPGDTKPAARPPIPEAVQERRPSFEQMAREKYGLPSDWRAIVTTSKGAGAGEYIELVGGVYKTKFSSGQRKGCVNYRRPEPGTAATVAIARVDFTAWLERWEQDTGYCNECNGTGLFGCGWSAESGPRYRTCKRCSGMGKAPCAN